MDDVLRRPRTSGQAPGQSVGVLISPPASGLPDFLELNHTVPAPQGHPTLHPNRTIQRAHGGPPDWVELLQCVGRRGHGRIILISDTTCKSLLGRLGRGSLAAPPMTVRAPPLFGGSAWGQGVAWLRVPGLAGPGRSSPCSGRTGAPEASATRWDRNPEPIHGVLTRPSDIAKTARDSKTVGEAKVQLDEADSEPDGTTGPHSNHSKPNGAGVGPLLAVTRVGR
jgi:hypothetical protein